MHATTTTHHPPTKSQDIQHDEGKAWDNNGQYTDNGITRYERMFGAGFISTGGIDTTREICQHLPLKDSKVLDVGSGLGGSAFLMTDEFNATVVGVDLLPEVVRISRERIGGRKNVSFLIGDAAVLDVGKDYDIVYTRDTLLHVEDKLTMLKKFREVLKDGGMVFISDYTHAPNFDSLDTEFKEYVKKAGYHMVDIQAYGKLLSDAGFRDVKVDDQTQHFLQLLHVEMDRLKQNKEKFVRELSQTDYDYLIERWEKKVRMVNAGSFKWGHLTARK